MSPFISRNLDLNSQTGPMDLVSQTSTENNLNMVYDLRLGKLVTKFYFNDPIFYLTNAADKIEPPNKSCLICHAKLKKSSLTW